MVERILKSFGLDFAFNCQNWVSWKPWLAPRVKGLDGLIKTVIFEFQTYSLNIRIQLGGTSASFWDEEHHLLPKISKNAAAKSPGPSPTVTPPHSCLTHTGKDEAWPSDLSSKNRTNLKKKHLNKYDPNILTLKHFLLKSTRSNSVKQSRIREFSLCIWHGYGLEPVWVLPSNLKYIEMTLECNEMAFQTVLHPDTFTHRSFYTQTLLHRSFHTQRLLHTEAFTRRPFYTLTLLHTDTFTHRRFCTQSRLHTDAFTHRRFYTQTLLHTVAFTHRHFCTQKLLHTVAFTHRHFCTQKLLHTDACTHTVTHRRLHTHTATHTLAHTQTLLYTKAFTHRSFVHTKKIAILPQFLAIDRHFVRKGCNGNPAIAILPHSFWRSNLISCEMVARDDLNFHFYLSFWRSNLISCERVAPDDLQIQFYLSFWRSNLISCERVARDTLKSQFYPSFWRSNLISCEKVARDTLKSQFYPSFWRSNLISCERVARDTLKSQFYPSFWRSNLISCERVAFRAVSLALPLRRCEKMWEDVRRCEEMWEGVRRCEDEQMRRRWEEDKMWRWEDVKMRRWGEDVGGWEDVKMRSCEDEKVFYRPPLLEELCAQTLSGKIVVHGPAGAS